MKKYLGILILLIVFVLSGCTLPVNPPVNNPDDPHTHEFVEGKCSCGEIDPNYTTPHKHEFIEGKCSCGEIDPNYTAPHIHEFIEGKCSCGEIDPNYTAPHTHEFIEGKCSCGEIDPNYTPSVPSDEKINLTLTGYSFESIYCEWQPFKKASSYNVYVDNKLIDSQLVRNYDSYYRADIVGLTNKEYTVKIKPIINGLEIDSASASFKITPISHVREGFAFVNGTASGAYNDDGTIKSDARIIYITDKNKDTVSLKMQTGKSSYQDIVGLQNILTALKKGYETKPICFRFIGNITDPAVLLNGDILIDGGGKFKAGITFEGIGNDATFNGFGLRIKNSSNVEIRNLGFMNCDSDEGDNISLQQDNDHIWVHNCDLFYGHAGSDADQAKGDGALDVKTSSYITLSYNHYWDSGKCNLQGMKDETTENYITYHHNWFDHSDSRHPRVRTCTVHIYNNYYDGNSKYGVGSTMGSSLFVENNYFRNCKNPMLTSKQGTDALGDGTFSGESGGVIKAFGNVIVGGNKTIPYSSNNSSYDYYDASSKDEVVPSSVKALSGGSTYNNFDTKSTMYKYNVQSAEDAKENVMLYAGRVQGGDFKWTFTNSDDSSYDVNTELKQALLNYETKLNLSEVVDLSHLEFKIASIPAVPTYSDIELIEECYNEYDMLSTSLKELVSNSDYLLEKYNSISKIKVEHVISEIDSMDVSNMDAVRSVLKLYNTLSSEERNQVKNYQRLADALGNVDISKIEHNFNNGTTSSFFNISGNISTQSKYGVPVEYNGITITKCLKLESSTSITFTTDVQMTLTLVFSAYTNPTIKIDNKGYDSSNGNFEKHENYYTFTITLDAGDHLISKKDSQVLLYMTLE